MIVDGWKDAQREFPTDGEEVLVCTRAKNGVRNIDKGYYSIDHWIHRGRSEVTHWMPLPRFPAEKWNAKIICIEAQEPYFTQGKIYDVEDGIFKDNLGEETQIFDSLEMLNDTYSAQFAEEVREE